MLCALEKNLTNLHNAPSITQPYCYNGQHLNVSLPFHDQNPALLTSLYSLKTLLFTLGPLFLPRLITYYRTQRTATVTVTSPVPRIPTSPQIYPALNLLFLTSLLALLSTLPVFSPENIFTLTSSRLQTSNDVLFTRLSLLRPNMSLTDADAQLKPRLASLDSRGLYLAYGPDVLTYCPFCKSDDPLSYFYYALPSVLLPHLLHLLALGLATSSAISGKFGSRWRTIASILGAGLAMAECYLFLTYEWKANARLTRPDHLTHFYWRMRTFRGVGIAVSSALLAALVWASSTNRIFVIPPSAAERMESSMKVLDNVRGRLSATGIVRNAMVRDEGLRRRGEGYWKREGVVMQEVMGEREVVEGLRGALESGRVQVGRVEEEARRYVEGVMGGADAGVGAPGT